MTTAAQPSTRTGPAIWTGRILGTLVVLFLLMDAAMHFAKPAPVVSAFATLGFPIGLSTTIALLSVVSTALYAIPRTSVLGAVLVTAYLGGATAIQARAQAATFPVLFPVIVGVLVWASLLLRDGRLRSLFPLRD